MAYILATALMGFFILSGGGSDVAQRTEEVSAFKAPRVEADTVLMTGYNPVREQTNDDPATTASGARSNPEIVAARSRDLADVLPYGTVIEIVAPKRASHACGLASVKHLIGYRVVADTMHPRKTNQVDIMFEEEARVRHGTTLKNPALVLGICEDIEIRVVGFVDIKAMPRTQTELAIRVAGSNLALLK